ncbi:MAG TPA: hypothetical protein VGR26_14480 [Acidimicrobiales bacterium]|nr:hypothetical protein [Acidimicrobiales bacterium]
MGLVAAGLDLVVRWSFEQFVAVAMEAEGLIRDPLDRLWLSSPRP